MEFEKKWVLESSSSLLEDLCPWVRLKSKILFVFFVTCLYSVWNEYLLLLKILGLKVKSLLSDIT